MEEAEAMGEARRRKLAGTYPRPDDPLAAARRFWCGRNPGPVQDFQVPQGLIGITLDVQGVAPVTCLMSAMDVTDVVVGIQRDMSNRKLNYHSAVRAIAEMFLRAKHAHDDTALQRIGSLGFWSAMYHPDAGAIMRSKVSDALRDHGRAHLSWQFSSAGLAIALADKFVELSGVIACAPRDRVLACVDPNDRARRRPEDEN